MPSQYFDRSWRAAFSSLGFAVTAFMSLHAAAESSSLTDASMTQAIGYYGVLAGHELSADDAAWLKRQWSEEFETSPQRVAAQVDDLALAFERHQRDQDPLALAQGRAAVLKPIYCATAQTSDPAIGRLKDILAPHGVVLAADCLLGLVVTRFDADGLVASHALLAAAADQPHDVTSDGVDTLATIETGFADAAPAEKGVLANGELRHAVLARYWSLIEGSERQRHFIGKVRKIDLEDLRSPARRFEDLVLQDLGQFDYLAMFRRNDAIIYEDCDQQVVNTKDEVDAFVGFTNFLQLLNERPPFDALETEKIRQGLASENLDSIETKMSAIREWWALLNLAEKAAAAQKVREDGITPEGDGSKIDFFIRRIQLQLVNTNAMRRICEVERVMEGARVSLFAARSGGYVMSERGGGLGYPSSDLENIVHANTLSAAYCG